MDEFQNYVIDKGIILQKTYSLLCIFFANKEIARNSDPNDPNDPLRALENAFFPTESSRLLLEIAAAMRVLDDQMSDLPSSDLRRLHYHQNKVEVNKTDFTQFHFHDDDANDRPPYPLREICNKIIHANFIRFEQCEGLEAHQKDYGYRYGDADKEIDWKHLNGIIVLSGKKGNKEWGFQLFIERFVVGVYELLR